MAWKEIDRDARITWLQATPERLYKLREIGDKGERSEIAMYQGTPGTWVVVPPPGAAKVVQLAGIGDQLVVVDETGAVRIEDGEGWSDPGFPARARVVVGRDDGALFGLDRRGTIWAATDDPSRWEKIDDLVENDDIVVAGNALYKRMARGSLWRYTGVPMTGWKRVDNNPSTVDIRGGGRLLLQIHDQLDVWQLPPNAVSGWVAIETSGRAIDVIAHGDRIFQRRSDGHVLRYTGVPVTGWTDLGGQGGGANFIAAGPRSVFLYNGERTYQNDV